MSDMPRQEGPCPLKSAMQGTPAPCEIDCKLLLPDGGCSFVAQVGLTDKMREEVEKMIAQEFANQTSGSRTRTLTGGHGF